jgi:flagellar motor switch protein FliN/FliY
VTNRPMFPAGPDLFASRSAVSATTPHLDANVTQILRLEVPIAVRLAERLMSVHDVVGLVPGSLIELNRPADAELDLMVNNKPVGCGTAVKVGENFGLRISYIGNLHERVAAMNGTTAPPTDTEAEKLAEAMLAGQM